MQGETVLVNGCFDIIHLGHINLLKHAKEGDNLVIVALNSDDNIKELKGDSRPINNLNDRRLFLESIKYVDIVIEFDSEEELEGIIKTFHIKKLIKGADYRGKKITGQDLVDEIVFVPNNGMSTSKIIGECKCR